MKKQDALFQLVKSLSRGEKRNFRILAQLTTGDKKYLQLFDVIDHLDEYDEQKVLKRFRRDPKFEKQLPYNKNYLYNAILNSLAYFHKGMEAEMSSIALHVRILLEKNLYFQAKKLLNKAKEAAAAQERFEELLKLLYIELEVLKIVENIKVLNEALQEVQLAIGETVDKISNLMQFRFLENQTFLLLQTRHAARGTAEQSEADGILSHQLLQVDSQALSQRAKICRNEILRAISFFKGEQEQAMRYAKQIIALFEEAPAIKDASKMQYLRQFTLYAQHVIAVEGPAAGPPLLAQLRELKVLTPQERVMRFEQYHLFSLALIIQLGEPANPTFLEDFNHELDALEYDLPIESRLYASYLLADYFVGQSDYSRALQWTNRFLNYAQTNLRTDLQAGMRLLNLLIHYELGNYDLIEYHLNSALRYLQKQARIYKYERRFLKFFKDVVAIENTSGHRTLMQEFRNDILEIIKDPFELRAAQVFDVVSWLNAKLDGIPMAAIKVRDIHHLSELQETILRRATFITESEKADSSSV